MLLHAANEKAVLYKTIHPLTLTTPLPHPPCPLKGGCLLARLLPLPLGLLKGGSPALSQPYHTHLMHGGPMYT